MITSACVDYTGLYTQSLWSRSSIFQMPVLLHTEMQKHSNAPILSKKLATKVSKIPRYSPICPQGQPPGMDADKCITPEVSGCYYSDYSTNPKGLNHSLRLYGMAHAPGQSAIKTAKQNEIWACYIHYKNYKNSNNYYKNITIIIKTPTASSLISYHTRQNLVGNLWLLSFF